MQKDDIAHLAHLARLSLSDQELAAYSQDFQGILAYISQLNELPPEMLERKMTVVENPNLRDDAERQSESADAIVAGFPDRDGRSLRVPQVLSYED